TDDDFGTNASSRETSGKLRSPQVELAIVDGVRAARDRHSVRRALGLLRAERCKRRFSRQWHGVVVERDEKTPPLLLVDKRQLAEGLSAVPDRITQQIPQTPHYARGCAGRNQPGIVHDSDFGASSVMGFANVDGPRRKETAGVSLVPNSDTFEWKRRRC